MMGEIKILKLINKFFKKEEDKIKAKYIYIQVDEDHIKERNKKLFGTTGVSIPTLAGARDELYYELKNIWYGKAV